jgi:hypothetical protein
MKVFTFICFLLRLWNCSRNEHRIFRIHYLNVAFLRADLFIPKAESSFYIPQSISRNPCSIHCTWHPVGYSKLAVLFAKARLPKMRVILGVIHETA